MEMMLPSPQQGQGRPQLPQGEVCPMDALMPLGETSVRYQPMDEPSPMPAMVEVGLLLMPGRP